MSKALTVLKVFFSLVSINSTETPSSNSSSSTGQSSSTLATTRITPKAFQGLAYVGQAFRIPIPKETIDAVNGEITKLAMKTSNYGNIRGTSWVQFDVKSREVYGFPLPGNVGIFFYKILVSDVTGALLDEIILELLVKANGFEYSHELILTTGTNFHRFMTKVEMRIDFATKLARYCFNEKPASILVKSFNKASRNMTIVFANIPYSPCNENTYSKLRSRILEEDTNVIEQKLQDALTKRFPIESAHFKFFGACDPNLFGPEPPFQWGWLKHFIPVAILLCVVGIPVTISCLVKKCKTKRPVVQEKRTPRTLRRRSEDGTPDLTSHTVHFNNRYPSMLSVSNNSKEDSVGEVEKGHGGKANIPNGSPSSRHLTVPNATGNRPRQGTAASTDKTKNSANQNNPFKFPFNVKDRASFNVRAMWDDDNDTERPPLNIPVYYTFRNNDEEEPSMLDAVLDMNFSDIAENISTKLKGVKSMLNISQAETAEPERTKPLGETSTSGLSLPSKLKDLGKSMLNVAAPTNESAGTTSGGQTTAPSLSTKLRDFGKSMLNISMGAQSDDRKESDNSVECQKTTFDDSDDSESYIYKPGECEDARSERQRYDDARRRSGFMRDDGSVHRQSIRRQSNASEYELSQYISARRHSSSSDNHHRTLSQGRRHSARSDYHQRTQDHFDNYHYDFGLDERQGNRRASRESDFDEYPDSLFDAPSEHSLEDKCDHEKSIFDTDFDGDDEETPCITKPMPIWNHVSAVKGRGGLDIESFPLNEVKYQDYTNPHQYSNGRVPRCKPSYSALGTNSYSSQSTLDFWDDDEYEQKSRWKGSLRAKDDFFTSFNTSVPDLRRGNSKGGIPNGTKPQSKRKASPGKSLFPDVGSLFSWDARDTREKPPVVFTLGDDEEEEEREQEMETDNSMVGMIKTKVSSLLEPDGNVSKWFSGFNKSDHPVT